MERAVVLADDSAAAKIRRMNTFDQGEQMRKLTEQVASIQRLVEPFAEFHELANSSSLKTAVQIIAAAAKHHEAKRAPGLEALKKLAESAANLQESSHPLTMDALAKVTKQMQSATTAQQITKIQVALADSPAMQQIARQITEMAAMNLAQALSKALSLPESTLQTSTEEPDEPESDE